MLQPRNLCCNMTVATKGSCPPGALPKIGQRAKLQRGTLVFEKKRSVTTTCKQRAANHFQSDELYPWGGT